MAGNRIKGITIEIGGDTTKLDKALAGTNKEIKTTQANLKDVERLLKMDPGNTELLAQKQRLLADAMEGTKKKAETLREAVSNADAALARGQDYKDKYAPLLQSLDEAGAAYEKLKDQKAEMDRQLELGEISTEAYDKWNAELKKSADYLKDLRKQVADTKEEMGGPMMDQAQFDALQREYIESKNAAEQATKAFESYNQTAEQVSANAGKIAEGAGKVASATKGISAAAGAAAGGLVALAVNAGKTADDLNTLSKQSGFSTETLQEWTYAADLVDVAVDDIIGAARKMKKNMVSESAETQAAFAQLGVGIYDNTGQLRDAEGVFNDLLKALSMVPNETERDVLAMQIFGKSADDLAGIIDDGGAALRQLGQEARETGLILSQDALDKANKFNDGLDTLKAKAQATFLEAGADLADTLLPALEKAVEAVGSLLSWFASLDSGTLEILLSVLTAIALIAPVASAISAIAGAVSAVSGAVGVLTGGLAALNIAGAGTLLVFGKWVLIIGAVVAAVWLLVEAFNALTGKSREASNIDISKMSSGTGSGGGFGRTYSMRTATAEDLPHLAQGTVARPNSPFMAVVGDNPQEPEIISPLSTIRQAVRDVVGDGGGQGSNIRVTVNFTGSMAQLARLMQPEITAETARMGPQFVK